MYSARFKYNEKNLERLKYLMKIVPKNIIKAIEFRNKSWFNDDVYNLLQKEGWVIVISHVINDGWLGDLESGWHPNINKFETKLNTIYIRFHGPSGRYIGSYKEDAYTNLTDIKKLLTKYNNLKNVFIYFNNTDSINKKYNLPDAVNDALQTKKILKNK
jgi:uncharacterized protein YecE (DUF72 family)